MSKNGKKPYKEALIKWRLWKGGGEMEQGLIEEK